MALHRSPSRCRSHGNKASIAQSCIAVSEDGEAKNKTEGRAAATNEQGSATSMALDGKNLGFGGDKYFARPLKIYFSRIDNNHPPSSREAFVPGEQIQTHVLEPTCHQLDKLRLQLTSMSFSSQDLHLQSTG